MKNAAEIVKNAERIYATRDIEAAVAMYTDDAVIVWNDREVARGIDQVRAFHERFFDPSLTELDLKKTLIASGDNVIVVEFRASWKNPDSSRGQQSAAEHWFMEGGKLREWRAFVTTKKVTD
jgi:nuclear transport factor 2 (NTF2) superfamily protein